MIFFYSDNTILLIKEELYLDPAGRSMEHYIECAFNFSNSEEAYIFCVDQCLLIN